MHPDPDPNPRVTDPDLVLQPAIVPDSCRYNTGIRKTLDNNKMHLKSYYQLLIKCCVFRNTLRMVDGIVYEDNSGMSTHCPQEPPPTGRFPAR
jgi:hypothetical protein